MSFEQKLQDVQHSLGKQGVDGWLFYDFRRCNELACEFLQISEEKLLTRRFFYWIPQKGKPIKIVHSIEDKVLDHLPGDLLRYHTWQEIESHITSVLQHCKKIAMEYSPRNAIPYVSKVDAGTMDVVRGCGVEVVTSADLLQQYTNVWDSYKLETHLAAAEVLCRTVEKAWLLIAEALRAERALTEYDVQQFILREFEANDCMTGDAPICAVNAHSADPHYCPSKINAAQIRSGDFILIDLWCKQKKPRAVYADITRVGVAAAEATPRQREIFGIVKQARDAATALLKSRFEHSLPITGCEVDECCRAVIKKAGYGSYFVHRTGHSIDENDHGNGANIDSLETRDCRHLLPGTCFSIEPGIYLPNEFGVRLEYDVFIHPNGQVLVSGGIQDEITKIGV
jgi:Xaa-Pro dipeptidase